MMLSLTISSSLVAVVVPVVHVRLPKKGPTKQAHTGQLSTQQHHSHPALPLSRTIPAECKIPAPLPSSPFFTTLFGLAHLPSSIVSSFLVTIVVIFIKVSQDPEVALHYDERESLISPTCPT